MWRGWLCSGPPAVDDHPPDPPGGHSSETVRTTSATSEQSEDRQLWEREQEEQRRAEMRAELARLLEATRSRMKDDHYEERQQRANRYGNDARLPAFDRDKHVPVLALINPISGAQAGTDILSVARATPYYQDRFFNIIDVVKSHHTRGGLMDVFRVELNAAREEARAMNTRPRIISGGGDGTGSFTIFMVFLALKADDSRADDGLKDTGNGFIWTDEELAECFPALVQMPLGSANDFANILGWGRKYPGDGMFVTACSSHKKCEQRCGALCRWVEAVISKDSRVVNFDVWGIMPADGVACDFKLGELHGPRGRTPNKKVEGKRAIHLKEAGKPVPFIVCLYFSAGFGAYMTARFQLNRRGSPYANRAEYIRQAVGIVFESTPPQMNTRLDGVEIECEEGKWFPPPRRPNSRGRGYREAGFLNINWQAHLFHGADRASVNQRVSCCSAGSREPVKFNDGLMDTFRWKFLSALKNPGLRMQTDKRKELRMSYHGERGKGIFFQWDGESRFAFSPTGQKFSIFIRRVMCIPVVLGPHLDERLTGNPNNGEDVSFRFSGDTAEDRESVRRRLLKYVSSELEAELNATSREIDQANFLHTGANTHVETAV